MVIDEEILLAMSYGSQFLGGGGGGSAKDGYEQGKRILEKARAEGKAIELVPVEELAETDGVFLTISGVGAPSAKEAYLCEKDYERIVELYTQKRPGAENRPIGILPSEMGGESSFGPFPTALCYGICIVDAACDGRAHPLGTMGGLGLTREKDYRSVQTASGGDPALGAHVEAAVEGSVAAAAKVIRTTASAAKGVVAVARNPVSLSYLKTHAAIGCYSMAIDLGRAFLKEKEPEAQIGAVAKALNGELIAGCRVVSKELKEENALDAGKVILEHASGRYHLYFYNEYMAMEEIGADGTVVRKYTFPDLMVTAGEDGLPISTADLKEGETVYLLAARHSNLILGAGLFDRENYRQVEEALGISLLPYIADVLQD